MNYKKESGRRLKAARQDKRLTLKELSRRVTGMHLSESRISNYEQGLRMVGVKECLALSGVLGVQAAYLLCVDVEEREMTLQENRLLRYFRALPEKDRNAYERSIEALASVHVEPVSDKRLSPVVRRGVRRQAQK